MSADSAQRLAAFRNSDRSTQLRKLFPAAGEDGLLADRFSGVLRCPYGERLHFVHSGFACTYPHALLLSIENDVLVSEEVKDSVIPPEGYPRKQVA